MSQETEKRMEGYRLRILDTLTAWFYPELANLDKCMERAYFATTEDEGLPAFQRASQLKAELKSQLAGLTTKVILKFAEFLDDWGRERGLFPEDTLSETLDLYLGGLGVRLGKLEGATCDRATGIRTV